MSYYVSPCTNALWRVLRSMWLARLGVVGNSVVFATANLTCTHVQSLVCPYVHVHYARACACIQRLCSIVNPLHDSGMLPR